MKHIWKIKRLLLPKRRKIRWNPKMSFFKNHRHCSLRTSTKGHLFRTFNSYWFNFNGGLCNRRTGFCLCRAPWAGDKQFLWFLKTDLLWFNPILLLFDSTKHLYLEMCLVRSTIAKLCQNTIHFDALDFSECCSEEMISFFWRSL